MENASNVSTELTLSTGEDLWDIKKTLTQSDVTSQSRLLIPKGSVKRILKYLTPEEIKQVEEKKEKNEGLSIPVYDSNTGSTYELCLKRWPSTGSYVLNSNWYQSFVEKRNLQVKDEIELFWNPYASRLHFRLL